METDGTNILLAKEEFKFYFTYNEFASNYPKHLQRWLELQAPNGTEEDFKKEYLDTYSPFFKDNGINGIDVDGFCGKTNIQDLGRLYKMNIFITISIYNEWLDCVASEYLKAGKDPAQVLHKEYLQNQELQFWDYYFTYGVRVILNTFFAWSAKKQEIVFDKYRYRRFTENIRSIVEFLYSEGQTLPEPVPAPQPQPQPQVGATAFTSSYPAPTQPPQPTAPTETAPPPAPEELSPLQWKGTKTELVELAKALEVSGAIECEKDIFKNIICTLEKIFNFEVGSPYKYANDIKNRNNGSEAKFLDKLKNSYYESWVSKESEKGKKR